MNALLSSLCKKAAVYLKVFREVLYGFSAYELDRNLQKDKGYINNLFMLVIFGDLAGLPLLPPYYAMRLLPYIIPKINTWKRSVLKEKDLMDSLVE
jgi:hypothetical protein